MFDIPEEAAAAISSSSSNNIVSNKSSSKPMAVVGAAEVAKKLLSNTAVPSSYCSSASSGFSSRRESLESEDDGAANNNNNNATKLGAGGAWEAAGLLLGTSPFSALLSSEEDEASVASSSLLGSSVDSALSISAPAAPGALKPRRRRRKKRLAESLSSSRFQDIYYTTGEVLGEGSYGRVETCVNMYTDKEFAVKIISKANWCFSRSKVLKEVELYYLCQGHEEIIQLVEYFEEPEYFYLIFEKARGGPLLEHIQRRGRFTEEEAAGVVRSLASALRFLHGRGIAHRDLKPENVLCVERDYPVRTVKLCDFDLCSAVNQTVSTPLLQSPVGSAEYMAPEVVDAFSTLNDFEYDEDEEDELTYDKKCDLWSLGVLAYVLLCGYLPFSGRCDTGDACAWESGGECLQCQRSLFASIKEGELYFPEQHWTEISEEARDLVARLLVKDAAHRLDAASVLEHPWIVGGGKRKAVAEEKKSEDEVDNNNGKEEQETTMVERNSVRAANVISRGFSNALNMRRFDSHAAAGAGGPPALRHRRHSRAGAGMRRCHTSQDFFFAVADENSDSPSSRSGGGGGGGGRRKTSAYAAPFTIGGGGAVDLNQTAPPSFLHPSATGGAPAAGRPSPSPGIKMRRQTSLIFPEEVNNNDRCEV